MLAIAALVALPLVLPDDGCEDCRPGQLCEPHAEDEAETLADWGEDLESEDGPTRAAALRRIGSLTEDHPNAPSKKIAEIVAGALREDPDLQVRIQAVRLIAVQHPDVAVPAMVETLKEIDRGLARGDLVPSLIQDDSPESAGAAMRFIEETMRNAGSMPDDRCLKELLDCMKHYPSEMRGQPIHVAACRALLELGTQESVDAVIDELPRVLEERGVRKLHRALESLAASLDLDDAPEYSEEAAKDWTRWFSRRRSRLPKKLGRLKLGSQ